MVVAGRYTSYAVKRKKKSLSQGRAKKGGFVAGGPSGGWSDLNEKRGGNLKTKNNELPKSMNLQRKKKKDEETGFGLNSGGWGFARKTETEQIPKVEEPARVVDRKNKRNKKGWKPSKWGGEASPYKTSWGTAQRGHQLQ